MAAESKDYGYVWEGEGNGRSSITEIYFSGATSVDAIDAIAYCENADKTAELYKEVVSAGYLTYDVLTGYFTCRCPFDAVSSSWKLFIWKRNGSLSYGDLKWTTGSVIPVGNIISEINLLRDRVMRLTTQAARAIKTAEEGTNETYIPPKAIRAGKVFGFDDEGKPTVGENCAQVKALFEAQDNCEAYVKQAALQADAAREQAGHAQAYAWGATEAAQEASEQADKAEDLATECLAWYQKTSSAGAVAMNNAKLYAAEAKESAAAAEQSAERAETAAEAIEKSNEDLNKALCYVACSVKRIETADESAGSAATSAAEDAAAALESRVAASASAAEAYKYAGRAETAATSAAKSASDAATSEANAAASEEAAQTARASAEQARDSAQETAARFASDVEDIDTRLDILEGNAAFTSLGLGWFQPNDSTEADTTAGYLDDKRRVLVGLDKTANVVMVRHGDYGSDGKWHDNTGVFAGIYAKFYDHENQAWKPAVPTAHATGKLYAENTLDKMGIMPWAGFREEVLTNTIGGETYEQHVIKIPKFYKAKFYNTTIRWKSAAASAGYIDIVGRLVIILPEKPVNSFTVGYDADGAGTNVLTVSPDDFALCGSCYRPKHVRSDTGEEIPAGETDCFYVSKYHPTNKTVGGVALLVSEKTASRNPTQTRGVFHTRAKANNQGSGSYIAASLPMDCSQDLIDLYEVEFATMNSQSVNTGATKIDAAIGMNYTSAWQLNNAENLDDCVRLGLENIPASGYVDYYGKCKTETDRAADETAAETVGNGKQYISRFIWRGMTNDIFGTAWNFLGDIEVIQYAAGEVLPTDFPAETLQVLKDAGFVFAEDAETGTVTVESTVVDVVCRRKRETPYEDVSALAASSVATRDGFWESHIQTGLYEVVPVALPVATGWISLRDAEGGYEFPSKAEKDFGIGGVDYFWCSTRAVAAGLVGGGSGYNASGCGLRAWAGSYGASIAVLDYGSRLYFVPFSAA